MLGLCLIDAFAIYLLSVIRLLVLYFLLSIYHFFFEGFYLSFTDKRKSEIINQTEPKMKKVYLDFNH